MCSRIEQILQKMLLRSVNNVDDLLALSSSSYYAPFCRLGRQALARRQLEEPSTTTPSADNRIGHEAPEVQVLGPELT
jgi:hypothetical protein